MSEITKNNQIKSRVGGARPGAGRKKGSVNKATADIQALARQYTPDAMKRLHQIATQSDSDAASVSAIKELFDRGYGKAKQAIEHSGKIETSMKEQRDAAVAAAQRANG